jgi:flagellar capping protein FliD
VNHIEVTNQRFDAMERKLDEKFAGIDQRFNAMDQKLDRLIALVIATN